MELPDPKIAAARLRKACPLRPTLAIVLGSGFHHVLTELEVVRKISYAKIPGFPRPTVHGHAGELYFGHLGGTPVVVLSGRAHFYEGHSLSTVTFAVRALGAFGIKDVVLTNAAGGINRRFRPGDFMLITDHINFMGANPLRGPGMPGEPRFVDLTETYDPGLRDLVRSAAKAIGLKLRSGVYLAVSGPSYETPAEIRAFAQWGADAVGMSTVPEAVAARSCGVRVVGISCISNLAAGLGKAVISHGEVLATGDRVKTTGARLLQTLARLYHPS